MQVVKDNTLIPFVVNPLDKNEYAILETGNITQIIQYQHYPKPPVTKKYDESHYTDYYGDIHEYKNKSETRPDNVQSLRRTFNKLRNIINANICSPVNIHWVTLTYAENMQDLDRLQYDYEKFFKRLKYYAKKHGRENPRYISVIEPQRRGAWHIHAIFIWDSKAPFIPNADLADLWGFGFVKIVKVDNCDNIGAYLSGYLADIPTEGTEDSDNKKIIKGGRLRLYPAGVKIYRHSNGLIVPKPKRIEPSELPVDRGRLTYVSKMTIYDDDGNYLNTITRFFFNKT